MTRPSKRNHERGVVRGCCLGVVLLLVVLGGGVFVMLRATAAPDLGAAPGGANDGDSEVAVAIALGAQAGVQLATSPHAVVTVSEHDLTVVAAAQNPHPETYRGIEVRSRNGMLAVSALRSFGPLTTTVVGYLSAGLDASQSPPQLVVNVTRIDVGALSLPGWLQDRLLGNYSPSITLNQLFDSSAALHALKDNMECVSAVTGGLRVGLHRPGTTPDTGVCSR
jgi:hypothetical protein